MNDDTLTTPRRFRFKPGVPDLAFCFFLWLILMLSGNGMLDDPGLGWHLRIPDLMWEKGGFLYEEVWSWRTEGTRWLAYGWLGDIPLRWAYEWSGLTGVAVFTSLIFAAVLRILFRRIQNLGTVWPVTFIWCLLALVGIIPSMTARPNFYSFIGVALTCWIIDIFHRDPSRKKVTLWLIPIFALWANMHGGFLAGALILALACLAEACSMFFSQETVVREQSRSRLKWWVILGPFIFLATLLTPYGWELYTWAYELTTDPYMQEQTTTEWRPPNFKATGWGSLEALVLALPFLAMLSRIRVSLVLILTTIGMLHFGLTSARYTTLWIVVAIPVLAELATGVPIYQAVGQYLRKHGSPEVSRLLATPGGSGSPLLCLLIAVLVLAVSPWLPINAQHKEGRIPEAAAQYVLENYHGERVFHSPNWGGYLTHHGWDNEQRFRIMLDDRIDVHGREALEEYRQIYNAQPGWEQLVAKNKIEVLFLPNDSDLVHAAKESPEWEQTYHDSLATVFRRISPTETAPEAD
ncbi:MAG: hypothetical protein HUJ26_07755 [Planctomycetaceae bacterium]|nr:hypothetical protein [Planctomycetaceae bacterium]